jgi:hypothetical protein
MTIVIEQHNLYINIDKYNTDYNFYNYNKFKLQNILPISYRSPSLFLDGLYFELPKSRILYINKIENSIIYEVIINISKNNIIYELLNKIDNYNNDFFKNNKDKFILKVKKSNKRTFYRNDIESKFILPTKNPLIKEYHYSSFYINNSNNTINMKLLVKHNYLIKIIELLNIKSDLCNKMNELYLLLINTEYFELKKKALNFNLTDVNLFIKFWIKSNNFIGNSKTELINMIWNICDYKL